MIKSKGCLKPLDAECIYNKIMHSEALKQKWGSAMTNMPVPRPEMDWRELIPWRMKIRWVLSLILIMFIIFSNQYCSFTYRSGRFVHITLIWRQISRSGQGWFLRHRLTFCLGAIL
jgi:hypothetical protein